MHREAEVHIIVYSVLYCHKLHVIAAVLRRIRRQSGLILYQVWERVRYTVYTL